MAGSVSGLLGGPLDAATWGAKAAELSRLAMVGLPVPSGLCVLPDVLCLPQVCAQYVDSWLAMNPAIDALAMRASIASEDLTDYSGAGQALTVLEVSPESESYLQHLPTLLATEGLRSVVFQSQERCDYAGVAFSARDDVLIEGFAGSTSHVTSGLQPSFRIRSGPMGVEYEGETTGIPWSALAFGISHLTNWCAREASGEVDVEWGWDNGRSTLFQCRPVTRVVGDW